MPLSYGVHMTPWKVTHCLIHRYLVTLWQLWSVAALWLCTILPKRDCLHCIQVTCCQLAKRRDVTNLCRCNQQTRSTQAPGLNPYSNVIFLDLAGTKLASAG